MKKCTVDGVAKALEASHGNMSIAAKKLGVSRTTLYDFIRCNPQLEKLRGESRDVMLDNVESALYAMAVGDMKGNRDPNVGACCFILKTQGKARGWIERADLIPMDQVAAALAELASVAAGFVDPQKQDAARQAIMNVIRTHFGKLGVQ